MRRLSRVHGRNQSRRPDIQAKACEHTHDAKRSCGSECCNDFLVYFPLRRVRLWESGRKEGLMINACGADRIYRITLAII